MELRKIATVALAFTLVCGAVPLNCAVVNDTAVYAEEEAEYTEGTYGVLTYKNYGDYIEITDCDTSAAEVEIPSEIDGVAVTKIGDSAFSNCFNLLSVKMPQSITYIGSSAFYWCFDLSECVIPDGVTFIGNRAFFSCNSLMTINIPKGVTSINDSTFSGCISLSNITIPENVISIGERAFSDCSSLINITIPENVISIGDSAFSDCASLSTAFLPDSVTTIPFSLFSGCTSLTTVTIPNSVTSIAFRAFYSCDKLTSIIIPKNVTSIGHHAFSDCKSLVEITVDTANEYYTSENGVLYNKDKTILVAYPTGNSRTSYTISDNVKQVGYGAFSGSFNLKTVTIPDSVISIEDESFYECPNLTNVIISDSVTSIGCIAFSKCASLSKVSIYNADCKINDSDYTISNTATIYGYSGSTAQAYAEKYGRTFVALDDIPSETVYGDANCDGDVLVNDAVLVMAYATNSEECTISEQGLLNADVYQSGDGVAVTDAAAIQKYLTKLIASLPES